MPKQIPPEHARYEGRYRAVYEAGVPHVQTKGDLTYCREFLEARPRRGRLLELGCGEGRFSAMAAGLGYEVTGVDSSPTVIAKARESHSGIRFEVADVCALDDFADASFDIVLDIGCLQMITDDDDARDCLSHAFRVLRPGGQAFFQNMVSGEDAEAWFPQETERIAWFRERLADPGCDGVVTETFEVNGRPVEVVRPSTPAVARELRQQVGLLAAAGFAVESARVVTRVANAPFEVILIAHRPDETG